MSPPDVDLASHTGLLAVLERAHRLGFTGNASAAAQITHALRFLTAIESLDGFESVAAPWNSTSDPPPRSSPPGHPLGVDLGSGAGLPGLVLALALPSWRWVLVDAMERRTDPLRDAVGELGLDDRVEVWTGRAEEFARRSRWRGAADLVTARGFGPPAVTAECAAPLLGPGGALLVSEPPESDGGRWPADGLAQLGLAGVGVVEGIMICRSTGPCPAAFPRRVGLPAKRPLF